MERSRRGKMTWVTEALFPCYMFVRCASPSQLEELRYAFGISSVVRFGDSAAKVSDEVIEDLQRHFGEGFSVVAEETLKPGAEVTVAGGAFEGMQASVLRVLPARQRVEVLLEILGRPTTVQVDRRWVALQQKSVADLVPFMAAA
jgi:transcriptional antiterminator RfaH